ncbi:N-acetyltransferase family protein [Ramlibacter sp. MMS24-I3-19]|uniref:GNAT family N-acetyltransferase n=1 Tax=Ramlibacter sp. MMS24-I3-19 TaxID=3416606 RepID=UPI003D025049
MESYEVTNAKSGDLDDVAEIHVRSWRAAYHHVFPNSYLESISVGARKKAWEAVLAEKRSDLLIARREARVVGFVSFGASRDLDAVSGRTGEIWALYVDPTEWGKGAGGTLWRGAEARLRRSDHQEITLWVLEANARALAFYERVGFTRDKHEPVVIERGGTTASEIRLVHGTGAE